LRAGHKSPANAGDDFAVGVACGEGFESLGGLVQRQDVGGRVHDRFDPTWPDTSRSNEASYDRN